MATANRALQPNYSVHLELSPLQLILSKKTEEYCLLRIQDLVINDDPRPIGIFQIKEPLERSSHSIISTATRLLSSGLHHVIAEKQPQNYIISSFGTKLDLRLLAPEDRSLLMSELIARLETLASNTSVKVVKIGDLIYFFDEEDADLNATDSIPTLSARENEERTFSYIAIDTETRKKFNELLTALKTQEREDNVVKTLHFKPDPTFWNTFGIRL